MMDGTLNDEMAKTTTATVKINYHPDRNNDTNEENKYCYWYHYW